jgi:hypothetical protein
MRIGNGANHLAVGILVTVIPISLFFASYEKHVPDSSILLATDSTAAFIIIDTVYVICKTISSIYLVDAVAQLILLIAWCINLIL